MATRCLRSRFSTKLLAIGVALLCLHPSTSVQLQVGSLRQCFPYVTTPSNGSDTITTLHILNLAAYSNQVRVEVANANGVILLASTLTVATGSIASFDLAEQQLPMQIPSFTACLSAAGPFLAAAYLQKQSTGTVAIYTGISPNAATTQYFGPFFADQGVPLRSKLVLQNTSLTEVTIDVSFIGGEATDQRYEVRGLTLPSNGSATWNSEDLNGKATFSDGLAWVRVDLPSGGQVTGVMEVTLSTGQHTYVAPMGAAPGREASVAKAQERANVSTMFVPRVHIDSLERDRLYRSAIFIGNLSPSQAVAVATFFREDGSLAAQSPPFSIGGGLMIRMPLPQFPPGTGVLSAVISSNSPVAVANLVAQQAEPMPESSRFSIDADEVSWPASEQILPTVRKTSRVFSVIGVQNAGTTPTQTDFTLSDAAGNSIYFTTTLIAPGAAHTIDMRSIPALSNSFLGSAALRATEPIATQVDLYTIDAPSLVFAPIILATRRAQWQLLGAEDQILSALLLEGADILLADRRIADHGGGIYRGTIQNRCTSLVLGPPSPTAQISSLASADSVQLAGALAEERVFRAENFGSSWAPTALLSVPIYGVAFGHSSMAAYAGADDGVHRSTDSGHTWSTGAAPFNVNVLRTDSEGVLWIGTHAGGIWTNQDDMAWAPVDRSNGLVGDARKVWDVVADQNYVYSGTENGVYRLARTGGVWQAWGLQGNFVRSLELEGNTLYAGLTQGGVRQTTLGAPDWLPMPGGPGWTTTFTIRDLHWDSHTCDGLLAATNHGLWVYR